LKEEPVTAIVLFLVCTAVAALLSLRCFVSVQEGNVGVLTAFGRYRRPCVPGVSAPWPWERVRPLSLQNRSMDLEFEAITVDQANVHFKCMLLFRVAEADAATIRRAAFAFATPQEFQLSMQRLLKDETRTYVSTQRQAGMIGISQDVVHRIKLRVVAAINEPSASASLVMRMSSASPRSWPRRARPKVEFRPQPPAAR
jgi:regulator of protease activity HflC (stomatin/prohibitin superfamily)